MKFSLVIPCYNEAASLPQLLSRLHTVFAGRADIEVILVDNGSTDETPALLPSLLTGADQAQQRSIRVEQNQGYGYGILQGLKAASPDSTYLGWTHADLQTDPQDVVRSLNLLKEQQEALQPDCPTPGFFIKGSRRGRSLFDNLFTAGMSLFETLYLRCPLSEINAQPVLFPRSFYESWQTPPQDFALDLYAYYLAVKGGLKVLRVPVQFPPRPHGVSTWNTSLGAKWKFIKRTVSFSTALKRRGLR